MARLEWSKDDIDAAVQLLEDTSDEHLQYALKQVGDLFGMLQARADHSDGDEGVVKREGAVWCPHLGASVQVGEYDT